MPHADTGNVAIVVHKAPLSCSKVELQDVVVDLIGVLVKASEGIYHVIANICDGGID